MQKLIFFPGAGFSLFDFYQGVPLSSVYCLILDFKHYLQGVNRHSFIRLSGFMIHKLIIAVLVSK